MIKKIKIFFFVAMIGSTSVLAGNETKTHINIQQQEGNAIITNQFLVANYNAKSRNLKITFKSGNKTFLKNIILEGMLGKVRKKEMQNAVFGKGIALVFGTADRGSISFALYPLQPFLFVEQTVTNSGKDFIDIQKLNPVSFLIDLNKSASKLKTLGTGGLLDPDHNPGSYVFLTTVDPTIRNGVVVGWLTNEKGSGVLFSDINNDLIEIKTQIDYGHFRLPTGYTEVTETFLIGYFDDARLGKEQFADAIAKRQNIELKPRAAVYCTWYSEKNGGTGTESSTI